MPGMCKVNLHLQTSRQIASSTMLVLLPKSGMEKNQVLKMEERRKDGERAVPADCEVPASS